VPENLRGGHTEPGGERVPLEVWVMLERMTLIDAGAALGISPDAVRMRIRRGMMQGEKDEEGRWLVWVDTEQAEHERLARQANERADEREPEPGEPVEPTMGELRMTIAVLEARLAAAESERDFLRKQVDTLVFAQGMQAQRALPNPERRGLWARLFGRG